MIPPKTTRTRKDKKMIAQTIKNGNSVRLSADYHVDTEKVYFTVNCSGTTFEFCEFAPAARVYKTLSKRIEGDEGFSCCLQNLVKAARVLGYSVKEAA